LIPAKDRVTAILCKLLVQICVDTLIELMLELVIYVHCVIVQ